MTVYYLNEVPKSSGWPVCPECGAPCRWTTNHDWRCRRGECYTVVIKNYNRPKEENDDNAQ